MKIGVLILCRHGSSRLPGKILKKIKGKTLLEYIHERVSLARKVDNVIVATSVDPSDNVIESFCRKHNYEYFRGSLEDVSDRFLSAASHYELDYAVRINGDNLFCDAGLIDEAIQYAINEGLDFVSNVPERTYPSGMSVEVINVGFYQQLAVKFTEDRHKEHVTLYLYETEETYKVRFLKNKELARAAGLQLAIDTASDFNRASKILDQLKGDHRNYNWVEISKLVLK